ncbi:MAG TPA: exodeoxyribonuclease VII small subunit [Microthrixaceae bacterium]|nr:exodeoxyribonuclease VII small subunit [Microthrixaceae bacterium]
MKQSDLEADQQSETIGFADAMDELNAIVAELESDRLDVDVLADRVERAAFLVGTCRDRLDATKLRVEEIIVRLDKVEPASAAGSGSADHEPDDVD